MSPAIAWTLADTDLGPLLVAATERGVCRIAFVDDPAAAEATLAGEFPCAPFARDDAALAPLAAALSAYVAGRSDRLELPLDVGGSRFRRRVWAALAAIPRGETRSYADVARAIGAPRAVRAVAGACAANPVAVAIPCHRVVASGGGLGGYRWGLARKRTLLDRERVPARSEPTPRASVRPLATGGGRWRGANAGDAPPNPDSGAARVAEATAASPRGAYDARP